MPLQGSTLCTILPAIGLALSMAYPNAAMPERPLLLSMKRTVSPLLLVQGGGVTTLYVVSVCASCPMAALEKAMPNARPIAGRMVLSVRFCGDTV